jgi:hypothetical protein
VSEQAPVLSVSNDEDGNVTATITNGETSKTHTIYYVRHDQSGDWSIGGRIYGNGSTTFALANPRAYWFYARSV